MAIGKIKEATCSATVSSEKFLQQFINDTCDKYSINSPARQLCFFAQVGHESGGLFYTEELASGAGYQSRKSLGNAQPGDGIRFKCRVLIQITGRSNYKSIGDTLCVEFIYEPILLASKNVKSCNGLSDRL